MPTRYPDQVKAVLEACIAYRNGSIGLEDLKSELWRGVQAVVAVEEAEFRRYLQTAEGRLDSMQFTYEDVRVRAIQLVSEIESRVRAHIA